MIEVNNLVKRYGDHTAVDHLSFKIEKGKIYGFLGPNGAGKSTTMNMITGYIASTEGTVRIDGHDILEEPEAAKKCIGYLPEQPPLYFDMTVLEYMKFVADLKKIPKDKKATMIEEVMDMVKISDMRNRLIKNLSKGYRQRVGLAEAIMGYPEVIILDEPTVGLDPAQVIGIRKLIRELGKTHTVILSSHILSEVQAVCSRVLILSKGALVAEGTPEQLSEKLSPGIRLRVTALGSSDTVLPVVEAVPGITGVQLVSEADGEVTFTAETADTTDRRAEVSRALSEAGCTVLELTAENRSLEEVFLALTGETADVPEEPETEPKGE